MAGTKKSNNTMYFFMAFERVNQQSKLKKGAMDEKGMLIIFYNMAFTKNSRQEVLTIPGLT